MQIPLFKPQTEWLPPTEFPDLSKHDEIAIDLETKDPDLIKKGSGAVIGNGEVIGIAVADIPKGSPLMKSAKPPAGDAIKPPAKPSGMGGGVQVDKSLMKGVGGAQGMSSGSGKQLPPIDAAKKISANKIAVLGITV